LYFPPLLDDAFSGTSLFKQSLLPQSSNFFAALDDSGDEAPAKAPRISVKKDTKKAVVPIPAEASKVDQRYVQ
jgi:hypothetical protein